MEHLKCFQHFLLPHRKPIWPRILGSGNIISHPLCEFLPPIFLLSLPKCFKSLGAQEKAGLGSQQGGNDMLMERGENIKEPEPEFLKKYFKIAFLKGSLILEVCLFSPPAWEIFQGKLKPKYFPLNWFAKFRIC